MGEIFMLYIIGSIIVIALIVMFLKKVFHLRVDDGDYNDEDDYLQRRVKKDEDDN